MNKLFGTDGVRGVANLELSAELAYKIGRAGAYVLTGELDHSPKILVGMDTRISGSMLESALVAGICSVGADAICLSIVPTSAVAYLIKHYKADAGVVISASHNPYEFNGIKFFDNYGFKLPDLVEERIESIIFEGSEQIPIATGHKIGKRINKTEAVNEYIEYLKTTLDTEVKGLKVAIDCANGAAYQIAPLLFKELGVEVYSINDDPDGININHNCGSTHLSQLKEYVKQSQVDIGLAFDGDADRVLAVDENGVEINGDQIMAIIACHLKKKNKLPKDTVVVTVMTNLGFEIMAKSEGLNVVKTRVGDRYVLEEMLANGYIFGGEQSGHVIFLEHSTTGDGILTALQLLQVLKESGEKLSRLAEVMQIFPQVLKNAKVKNDNKHKYLEDDEIANMCRELENDFHGEGRVLIRPSGTEPLVRVMIEGRDETYINDRAIKLVNIIEERLG